MAGPRELFWPDCRNVRDLGGLPLAGGGVTRFRSVVRADNVRRLTDTGVEQLVAYGVSTVVDLRYRAEREADPPRELTVPVVSVPLLGERPAEDGSVAQLAMEAPSVAEAVRAVYLWMLERFRPNFARAIEAVAAAPAGVVLVHCQGGKDRAGLVAALLLRLAGVELEPIARDYALSERNLGRWLGDWIADAADPDEREVRRRIAASPAEAMVGVLEELERRYGDVRGYLREAGADAAAIAESAARLR